MRSYRQGHDILPLAEIAQLLTGAGPDRQAHREQFSEMIEQRQRVTAALTPEQVGELQRQRAEQVSRLTPGQLAELHQQRQQLLPDGFPLRD